MKVSNSVQPVSPGADELSSDGNDYVSLRDWRIGLPGLWDQVRFDTETRKALRASFINAEPFAHLVIDDIFDAGLLNLIVEEMASGQWRHAKSHYESTHRSSFEAVLGPAAELYFSKIHSKAFVQFLVDITGIDSLIPDSNLIGGGLHESKTGDWMAIHFDFARHPKTNLHNEMVFLTYLNKDWKEEYGGALELWDQRSKACAKTILPVFGRSVILKYGKTSLHGHTRPVSAPGGRPRRSVAAYYYGHHDKPRLEEPGERSTQFFLPGTSVAERTKTFLRLLIPPLVLQGALRLRDKFIVRNDWESTGE